MVPSPQRDRGQKGWEGLQTGRHGDLAVFGFTEGSGVGAAVLEGEAARGSHSHGSHTRQQLEEERMCRQGLW